MRKSIYSILSALLILMLGACSKSPWVGEWTPSNDTSGNSWISLKSNGTAEMITDASDGYAKISGTWSEVSEKENTIRVSFDPNTLEIDFDNPIAEMMVSEAIMQQAKIPGEFVLKADGNRLENTSNPNKAFVKK